MAKQNPIEISVIIPTYNKYPQNLLTLYSLEHQSFDLSKVEVIMIDDGSTDQTKKVLESHPFPFSFYYIRSEKNIGRPAARNLGLKAARGNIIIFLDAEILVRSNFLQIHHSYHQQTPNLVVTGIMFLKRLYSVLFPDFSQKQLEECRELMMRHRGMAQKFEDFTNSPQVIPLIEKRDIFRQNYTRMSLPTHFETLYKYLIINNYGYSLTNYQIPWQLFGTGHVSVSKKAIDQVGPFAEYPGYGWDDCEMGYRLYKNGATYVTDRRLISYHQEHPVLTSIKDESKKNYYRFQETYKEVDQMIISLTFLPHPYNLHETNQIYIQYQQLMNEHLSKLPVIRRTFYLMLRKIGVLASQKSKLTNLKPELSHEDRKKLKDERLFLKSLNRYELFIECFERLENL
ncbi:glycosyltransferase family A protein [Pseudalkalibacillus sp. SCS-8]|uniref:glycosyltransferase family A protein n=1 Tax=Pseudalkalibacillus nanhaiensis TaxID=3115291 RepID=UPI0032DAE55A